MPRIKRPGGIEIHWEERGHGPPVVLVSYWNIVPRAVDPITDELSGDHRVIRYDDRGAGESTRLGPYDLDTAAADLQAVIEEVSDQPAVLLGTGDGPHRAVRVGAQRPDLVEAVVCVGGPPVGRHLFGDAEAMAASDVVVNALLDMARTDYRAALRSVVTSGNPQMTEDEIRARVDIQSEHADPEVSLARLRAWTESDSMAHSSALGDRLWILHAKGLGGGWFPAGRELEELVDRVLPEAHLEEVDDGMVSRPDQTAAVVRRITSRTRAARS
jgi:pimeloyl-ACP methyl ester carboxylesterase